MNPNSTAATPPSDGERSLPLIQVYFLIVLGLAVTNLLLGIIYGCLQHKKTIHSHICCLRFTNSADQLRGKRPISANLVLNAGIKKTQLRQTPTTYTH